MPSLDATRPSLISRNNPAGGKEARGTDLTGRDRRACPLVLGLTLLERISKLRSGSLARRERARKRSIHAVCMQVRRAGTLRFCQETAHDALIKIMMLNPATRVTPPGALRLFLRYGLIGMQPPTSFFFYYGLPFGVSGLADVVGPVSPVVGASCLFVFQPQDLPQS